MSDTSNEKVQSLDSDTSNEKVQSLDVDSIIENYTKVANDTEIGEQSMESIIKWIENYEFQEGDMKEAISSFTEALEKRISKLDCLDSNGRTIIPYMGTENGVGAWQYAAAISGSNEGLVYISDLEIGKTLNDLPDVVRKKLYTVIKDTKSADKFTDEIFNGADLDGTVYAKDVVSVNDYVSAIVMDKNISATQTDLFVCILESKYGMCE